MSLQTLLPEEGKVYELLLVTKTNVTPVGVVRRGNILHFKLFEGRSFEDLKAWPYAVLHVVDDVELLVKAAFNFSLSLEFVPAEKVPLQRIEGFSWIEGSVKCLEGLIEDSLGSSQVLRCTFAPVHVGIIARPPRPLSRADCYLLELAVLASRILVARKRGIDSSKMLDKARELFGEYERLGGRSETAREIMRLLGQEYL
ncbi:DUF447 domain-containing protein [Pyrococcus yayanosii]|uniref:DUF447 family protein n=1 Tax=Pyrococcus yayanosii (strain CH1 / JCM 16557) TaxID=529709 RepID=F8AEQ6_PYRYC|nr:DUF447 domain-containing protein [Pyrococcus yayanosii]AEH24738.1 hypothetical protein PYCH_10570 [Pyrococcus yayanosii CH1]